MLDTEHILKDAGAVTSSGYGQVDSEAQVIDLGDGLVRGNVVMDIVTIDIANSDEKYEIHLMGGNDISFTGEVSLCCKELGANEALQGNLDSKLSRVILPFQNEERGVVYPYVRVRHVVSGTTPSINYKARLEKDLSIRGITTELTVTTTTTTTSSTTTTT